MRMIKEQMLEVLKQVVLAIVRNPKGFKNTEEMVKWQAKNTEVTNAINELNASDKAWINTEYSKWFNNNVEIQRSIKEREETLKSFGPAEREYLKQMIMNWKNNPNNS